MYIASNCAMNHAYFGSGKLESEIVDAFRIEA